MKIVMGFFYVVPAILFMIMGTCLAFYVYMGHSEAQNMTLCAGGYGPTRSLSCPCEAPDCVQHMVTSLHSNTPPIQELYEHVFESLVSWSFVLPAFSFDIFDITWDWWDLVLDWRIAMPSDLL